MDSKSFQLFKDHQAAIIAWALLIKLMLMGLTLADCLGAFVILSAQLVAVVISKAYPTQPDLFHEISVMQNEIKELQSKNDSMGRDVSALKIGTIRQR